MHGRNIIMARVRFLVGGLCLGLVVSACASQPEKTDAAAESEYPRSSDTGDSAMYEELMYGLPEGPWKLVFADGSGNAYTFTGDGLDALQLSYRPVKPAMSSSGTYDGGKPLKTVLTRQQAIKAWELVREYAERDDAHIEHRVMGSGSFVAMSESESYEFIVPNGEELQRFVSFAEGLRSP